MGLLNEIRPQSGNRTLKQIDIQGFPFNAQMPLLHHIALGRVSGYKSRSKFGLNTDVDIAAGEDVVAFGARFISGF